MLGKHSHTAYILTALGMACVLILTGCGTAGTVPDQPAASATAIAAQSSTAATASALTAATPTSVALPSASAAVESSPAVTTPAASTAATESSAPPAQEQLSSDQIVAVQTVLDHYRAINDRDYAAAYSTWANNGAASGQTLDEFTQGFTETVQVDVQLGNALPAASAMSGRVQIPVDIAAVVNDARVADLGQKVQRFSGSYTVQTTNGSGKIIEASITELSGGNAAPASFNDPVQLIQSFYNAINSREFAAAYTHWASNGQASQQSFADFVAGFAETQQVAIELGQLQEGGAAGSIYAEVPIVIAATKNDGTQQTFCGTYTLRRSNQPPFDQLGWHIDQAQITSIDGIDLNTAQSQQVLSGGCPVPGS